MSKFLGFYILLTHLSFLPPSVLALALITVLLFHGNFTRALDLIIWVPVFLSASLLAAVNIAPPLSRRLEAIKSALPILVVRREPQERDLEGQPLMEDYSPEDPDGGNQEGRF